MDWCLSTFIYGKVPSSAAINESVNLAKQVGQDYYSKLINAVLHKIDNDRKIPDDLSVKYSVPQNLINMWIKQYGEDKVKAFYRVLMINLLYLQLQIKICKQ